MKVYTQWLFVLMGALSCWDLVAAETEGLVARWRTALNALKSIVAEGPSSEAPSFNLVISKLGIDKRIGEFDGEGTSGWFTLKLDGSRSLVFACDPDSLVIDSASIDTILKRNLGSDVSNGEGGKENKENPTKLLKTGHDPSKVRVTAVMLNDDDITLMSVSLSPQKVEKGE